MTEYIIADTEDEYYAAKLLFKDYAKAINIDLSFQDFETELLELKTMLLRPIEELFFAGKK